MRYRVLGPLEVQDGTRRVQLRQGRQRLLLAVLLMAGGEPVSSDRLIDALWDEQPPPSATASLHNLIAGVRKALGDGRIVTRDHGYALRLDGDELDSERFHSLSDGGRAALADGDPRGAVELLSEALELWRGPALGDLADHRALADAAARLEDRRLGVVEDRIDAELARGRHDTVLPELARLTQEHPFRERLRRQQMLALYRAGRQAEALAAYREARQRLVGELGVEPGPALRGLEQAILDHDPALGAPTALPPPPRIGWARRRAGVLVAAAAVAVAAAAAAVLADWREPTSRARGALARDVVVALDPATGRIAERHAVGATPTAVSIGAGAAWTVDADDRTVTRVDLRTGARRTVRVATVPIDVAASAEGVWVVTSAQEHRPASPSALVRLDPASGGVVDHVPLPRGGDAFRIDPPLLALTGGAVWVIEQSGRLVRVEPRSGSLRALPRLRAQHVAAGNGQLWALVRRPPQAPRAPNLVRIDPVSGAVMARVLVPSDSLATIAVGAGAVWAADGLAGGVWRVDPRGLASTRIVAVGPGVDSVAAHAGEVWTASSAAGTVTRIDPVTERANAPVRIGSTPRAVALGDGRLWVALAGIERGASAAGSLDAGADVAPIASRECGPVATGPDGEADVLIASDDVLEGELGAAAESINAAIAFVLREHGYRAGRFRVGMQACNDALAQTGFPDEAKCRANARAYARNPAVVGVVGPSISICAAAMLPILNTAPAGPVSIVSTINSHARLVGRDPLDPDSIRTLYPAGRRGFARMMTTDDYEAAAGVMLAQRLSPQGMFYVQQIFAEHEPWSIFVRRAARRLGLPILGSVTRPEQPGGERGLAQRILRSGAGVVYLHGTVGTDLRRLRGALGPDVAIVSSSLGALPIASLFDAAGDAARGIYVTSSELPPDAFGASGERFAREFGGPLPGDFVPRWAYYGAAAAEVMLDAIGRSDGTRASIASALARTRDVPTPLGPITLEASGERTTHPVAILRAERREAPLEAGGMQGAALADVLDPPARLVGAREPPAVD
jgi:DNA-binding SARP family transcriptional activator/ABC-type branched-subunit amino acid transport system substrate-binding protein